MKILITGIGGAIGSHVAEALLRRGDSVVGIDNLDPYYDPRIKRLNLADVERAGGKVVIADINDHELATLGDVDAILHFAAQPGISAGTSFDHYLKNNIAATNAMLRYALEREKLHAFVHISTSSVYGVSARGSEEELPRPTSPYGVTKLAAEQLALSKWRSDKLPVTALRLFSVFGPRERPEKLYHKLIHATLTGNTFPLHEGSEKHLRSFTYIDDIVDGVVRALDRIDVAKGEIINIGTDELSTTGDGLAIIERIMGQKLPLVKSPPRYGDQKETHAVIAKAKAILDFSPKVTLEEGLRRQYDWHVNHLLPHLRQ
jgi:nucleoside-diphosphate-sugar epimerase